LEKKNNFEEEKNKIVFQ